MQSRQAQRAPSDNFDQMLIASSPTSGVGRPADASTAARSFLTLASYEDGGAWRPASCSPSVAVVLADVGLVESGVVGAGGSVGRTALIESETAVEAIGALLGVSSSALQRES